MLVFFFLCVFCLVLVCVVCVVLFVLSCCLTERFVLPLKDFKEESHVCLCCFFYTWIEYITNIQL